MNHKKVYIALNRESWEIHGVIGVFSTKEEACKALGVTVDNYANLSSEPHPWILERTLNETREVTMTYTRKELEAVHMAITSWIDDSYDGTYYTDILRELEPEMKRLLDIMEREESNE